MQFHPDNFYHIYNRGNNKQKIFYSVRNYEFFLEKVRKYLIPHCSIISYSLMPNHFHFLIYSNENSIKEVPHDGIITRNVLSDGVRMLLSSYAKAINKQEGRTGNLFQQKTKSKSLAPDEIYPGLILQSSLYEEDCFNYIHYNAVKAGLVSEPGEWKFSSYNEYFGGGGFHLCDTELGAKLLKMLLIS